MSNQLILILVLIARCSLTICFVPSLEPDWEYMMVQASWNSTDENLFRTDIRPIRIEPGVYALNGTLRIGEDIDDSFLFAVQVLYSSSGNGKWSSTPFQVKPTNFYKFMNTAYKEYLNDDLSRCAGTPYVGDEEYNEPFKAATLFANKCMVETSNLPTHLRPGYYKLVVQVDGPPVYFYAEVIAKVDAKSS